MFEKLQDGKHEKWLPVLLEIDRGTQDQAKFRERVKSRIEFIRSGAYRELFETEAVTIAYATTGETPEYRETRRRAMCTWTREVLKKLQKEKWASVFRFNSLCLDDIYTTPLFEGRIWYRPDSALPVELFTV